MNYIFDAYRMYLLDQLINSGKQLDLTQILEHVYLVVCQYFLQLWRKYKWKNLRGKEIFLVSMVMTFD